MIFITEPRVFTKVDNTTYTICGISAKLNNSKEVVIGQEQKISFELTFHSKVEGVYTECEKVTGNFNKRYNIPNIGEVDVVSNLFSTNVTTLYNSAKLIAQMYGYTLKTLEEQTFLNT